jgi:hypothetical protein
MKNIWIRIFSDILFNPVSFMLLLYVKYTYITTIPIILFTTNIYLIIPMSDSIYQVSTDFFDRIPTHHFHVN